MNNSDNSYATKIEPCRDKPLEGMKVCFVGANHISQDTRAVREAISLANAGAKVVIASADNSSSPMLDDSSVKVILTGENHPPQHPVLSKMETMRIIGRLTWYFPLNRVLSWTRRRSYLKWTKRCQDARWRKLEKAVVEEEPDVIQCVNLYSALPALRAAKRLDCLLVYDSYEYWQAVISDPLRANLFPSSMTKLLIAREREIAQSSAAVITVNEMIASKIEKNYGINGVKVIYNGPLAVQKNIAPTRQPIKLLVQGSYQENLNVENVIRAMSILGDGYSLTLQGIGMDNDLLRDFISSQGLKNEVLIADLVSLEETVSFAARHDIGIYTAGTHHNGFYDENFDLSAPNKIFTYMAAGLALAVTELKFSSNIVRSYNAGVVLSNTSPEDIAHGIQMLASNASQLDSCKQNSLAASKDYLWEKQADKLVSVYERLKNA